MNGRPDERHQTGHPVVLFDGVCLLCNSFVRFILARDGNAQFRFAPLQSEPALRLLERSPVTIDTSMTVVLVDGPSYRTASDAVVGILERLPATRTHAALIRFLPQPLRDVLYRIIARRRYALFGRHTACMVPSPDVRNRFL